MPISQFKSKIKSEIKLLKLTFNSFKFGPIAAYWIEIIIIFAKDKSSVKVGITF